MLIYKRLNLLVGFIIVNTFAICQTSIYSNDFIKSAKYADKAELFLTYNNLLSAETYYDSLFQILPIPSGHDIFNRALCAKRLGNEILKDSLLKILFFKGYKLANLSKCFDTTKLHKLITAKYLLQIKTNQQFVDLLLKNDQRTNYNKRENPEAFIKTVLDNIKKIIRYTHNTEDDSINYFTLESSGLYVCMIHFYQMWHNSKLMKKENFAKKHQYMSGTDSINYESYNLDNFLIEQVEKGHLHRGSVAFYFSFINYPFPYQTTIQLNNYIFTKEPHYFLPEDIIEINRNRELLGMCSYQDYFRLAYYTDSILTNGKPFKVIPRDSIEIYIKNKEYCGFNLLDSNYRTTLFFRNDETAKAKIENIKSKFLKKD